MKKELGYWNVTRRTAGNMIQDFFPQECGGYEEEHKLRGLISLEVDHSARTWKIWYRRSKSNKSWKSISGTGDYPELPEAIEMRKKVLNTK